VASPPAEPPSTEQTPEVAPAASAAPVASLPLPPPSTPIARPTPPPTGAPIATVAELPAAERRQLPAMKLSMHMWNERPAQRFVILDGIRYGEGDRIGAAVITAIDTDGIVLDLNGRAVRLPLR
jgi:general secretion pathway protein B